MYWGFVRRVWREKTMNFYSIDKRFRDYETEGTLVKNARFIHHHRGSSCQMVDYLGSGIISLGIYLNHDIALTSAKRDYSGTIYPCPCCMGNYVRQ